MPIKGKMIMLLGAVALGLVPVSSSYAQTTVPPETTPVAGEVQPVPGVCLDEDGDCDHLNLLTRLSETFGVELQALVDLVEQGYEPEEIWLALEIAAVSEGTTFEDALVMAKDQDGHGWGLLAKMVGVKPGSEEFRAMKEKYSPWGNGGGAAGARDDAVRNNAAHRNGQGNGKQDGQGNGSGNGRGNGRGAGRK